MDYQTLRGVVSAVLLVMFIGIIWWAFSSRQKAGFDQAANSIFDDERSAVANGQSQEPKA